jgi:tRNA threonylcarbamoyladenosine modification (KEOPS) complex  Pcc1 subunit
MKKTDAKVVLDFDDPVHALAVFNAVKPETTLPPTSRSRVEISRRGRSIHISFVAKDITALRASMNSILRYILGLWKTTKSLEELEKRKLQDLESTSKSEDL